MRILFVVVALALPSLMISTSRADTILVNPPEDAQACIVGNPAMRVYADQMVKAPFTQDDSFLRQFWKHKTASLLPSYIYQNRFQERISKEKVMCSIRNIPFVDQNRMLCDDSRDHHGRSTHDTPCVTNLMVDYIYWGVNEAMRCFSDYMDEYVQSIIFRKIHLESSFGFFFQYVGGTGAMQLVGSSQKEMFHDGEGGHEFLEDHVNTHPQACSSFHDLLAQTSSAEKLYNCEFISIGDGIGRNLLGGIGLYLYYRSGPKNPQSAERILNRWGYYKTKSAYYSKVRAYLASGMYNKGDGAVYFSMRDRFAPGSLEKLSEEDRYAKIMNVIYHSSFSGYVRALEKSPARIFDENGHCAIKDPLGDEITSDELAYQHSEQPLASLLKEWGEHGTPAQYLRWRR